MVPGLSETLPTRAENFREHKIGNKLAGHYTTLHLIIFSNLEAQVATNMYM